MGQTSFPPPIKSGSTFKRHSIIHTPGPPAAPMAVSVLAASLSVLVSLTLLISILVFHASVSVIMTPIKSNVKHHNTTKL